MLCGTAPAGACARAFKVREHQFWGQCRKSGSYAKSHCAFKLVLADEHLITNHDTLALLPRFQYNMSVQKWPCVCRTRTKIGGVQEQLLSHGLWCTPTSSEDRLG